MKERLTRIIIEHQGIKQATRLKFPCLGFQWETSSQEVD